MPGRLWDAPECFIETSYGYSQIRRPTCKPAICSGPYSSEITKEEPAELVEHIINHKFDAIPLNYIEARLGAQWEFEMTRTQQNPKRYKFNDEIDRWRVAVALTYCDMFITDSGAAELARAAVRGLDEKAFTCQIISVRQTAEIEAAIKLM